MSDYQDKTGVQYCMPGYYAEGVKSDNAKLGYHNMADRANTGKVAQPMKAAKMDKQESSSVKFGY